MKPILVLQFRTDQSLAHEQKCFAKFNDGSYSLEFANPLNADFNVAKIKDLSNYSGLILGGSAQFYLTDLSFEIEKKITQLIPFIRETLYRDFPTLGICFGHQLLAQVLGGTVEKNPDMAETGGAKITLKKKSSRLFEHMPHDFYMIEAHKDSVTTLPETTLVLASSERCPIQAFSYKDNVFAVQFHPEIDTDLFLERVVLYPEYLKTKSLEDIKKDLVETPYAKTVLDNFVKICHNYDY